jgi:hypothetical protein
MRNACKNCGLETRMLKFTLQIDKLNTTWWGCTVELFNRIHFIRIEKDVTCSTNRREKDVRAVF